MSDNQVETDTPDELMAADQLAGAGESQKGTSELSAYDADLADALSDSLELSEQGEGLDDIDDETEEDSNQATEQDEIEDHETKSSRKIRFSDPIDLAVAAIAKAKKISLVEAAKVFSGERISTEHQDQRQHHEAQAVDTVNSVQERLEELENLEAEASSSLEFETANEHRKEANKLRNKLMDLKIAEVQEKSRSQANEERKFYDDYAASEAEAVKYYPDAAKADSPMHREMILLEKEMLEMGDPLYYSENKPFVLAKKAARNLGIAMTNPNRPVANKSAQNRPVQPAGGNARTSTPTTAISKIDQAVASVKTQADYDALVADLMR